MCLYIITDLIAVNCWIKVTNGRVIAQAVSRRLPTAAARIRAQVRSCRICGGQNGTGTGFLSPSTSVPQTAPHSSLPITLGWYNRPVVTSVIVDSGPLHPTKGGKKKVCKPLNFSWVTPTPIPKQMLTLEPLCITIKTHKLINVTHNRGYRSWNFPNAAWL
jgi:hypothetical protein